MQFAKNIVNLREEIDVLKKRKKDLIDIANEVSELNKELNNLRISLDEYQRIKKRFENFSEFEFNDADDLYIKYAKYENLKDENTRILEDIDKIKKCADENRSIIESLKAFEVDKDINVVDSTINTDFNLESIKRSEIEYKIKILKSKNRAMVTAMTAIFLSAAALLFYSLSERNYYCIVGSVLLLIVFLAIGVFKLKNDKQMYQLTEEKYRLDKRLNSLLEEMEEKRLMQEEMFKKLEVNSMEEFLKKKALYDSKLYELDIQKKRMAELKEEVEKNCILIEEILQFIKEKLIASNVIDSIETEVKKEHIETFRSSIYKYKETVAYLSNGEFRFNDLYKQIENLYLRVYSICGQKIDDIEQLNEVLNSMEKKIEKLYESLDIYAFKIKSIYSDMEFEGINYEKLMEILFDLRIEDAKDNMEKFTQKLFNETSSIQLHLKEKEIAQSALNDDNNELEKIEENIRELELQKEKLEDIGFSLKTALEALEEANTEIKRDFAPVVNSNASKIISLITDFRYKELKVDENLVLRTTDPYVKDIVPVSVLSNGTVDQMYLALRIALVQTMEKRSEKLPIILDEVLSQYDEMRSLNTIKMLKEISNERQVIFFTCKSRELEMVKSVCNNDLNIIKL
ncbi:MAG TPA: chromosome segregation protein SMC [Acetivibrio clariflavus]|nr:chromosome segregation protein SMC [Acetivibrio clariflavus]